MNRKGWLTAAFAETVPGVYAADEAAVRRGEPGQPAQALFVHLQASWRATLSRLRPPRSRGRSPPP
jgi:hypothetical protein